MSSQGALGSIQWAVGSGQWATSVRRRGSWWTVLLAIGF